MKDFLKRSWNNSVKFHFWNPESGAVGGVVMGIVLLVLFTLLDVVEWKVLS